MTSYVNEFWMASPQYARRGLRWECCIENRYVGFGWTRRQALHRAESARRG